MKLIKCKKCRQIIDDGKAIYPCDCNHFSEMNESLKDIKTLKELMLICLEKYTQIAINMDKGDYTNKMNSYEMGRVVWFQYLYWKDKMEKAEK